MWTHLKTRIHFHSDLRSNLGLKNHLCIRVNLPVTGRRQRIAFTAFTSPQYWWRICLSFILSTIEPISVSYLFKNTLTWQMCREKRLKLPVFKGILMSQKCLTVFGGYHCSRVSLYPQRFITILTPMHHRFDTCGIEPISLAKILHGKKKTDIWTSRKIWLLRAWAHVWYVFFNIINRTMVITLF